jgi:hypothetical protein
MSTTALASSGEPSFDRLCILTSLHLCRRVNANRLNLNRILSIVCDSALAPVVTYSMSLVFPRIERETHSPSRSDASRVLPIDVRH